jgi:predicted metal-dependent hydrolase
MVLNSPMQAIPSPMKQKQIEFLGSVVEIEHNKRLKNSYIRIKNGTICVKTPYISEAFIADMLHAKKAWIQKALKRQSIAKKPHIRLQDEVLLFNEIVSIDHPDVYILRQKLCKISSNEEEKILQAYENFYKEFAKEYLTKRVDYFAEQMQLSYECLRFRKMKSRWGSCSSQRKITLNTELVKIDKMLIDYVVVHELAHLVHMNHSKAFHALVEHYLSDAKERRKKLKNITLLG